MGKELKFYRVNTIPSTDLEAGAIYFEVSTKKIKVATSSTTVEDYGVTWRKLGKPNNEIWYKTSDKQPVTLSTLDWGTNEIISNEYDAEKDCCVITFKDKLTEIPDASDTSSSLFGTSSKIQEVVFLPSTIKRIGNNCFSFYNNNIKYIDLSNCKQLEEIGNNFYTNYNSETTIIDFTNCHKLKTMGNDCLTGSEWTY